MSKRDTTLDLKILESAKREFLEKGFLEASLQKICDDAGVTTGSIYRRYRGKEELFVDVVKPAIELFEHLLEDGIQTNAQRALDNRMSDSWVESEATVTFWVKKIYREYEAVKILLARADGTMYANFTHEFIEKNFSMSYDFMKLLEKQGKCSISLSYVEYHILLTSFWTALFEMIVHDVTLEEALSFVPKICQFFAWNQLISFDSDE